MYWLCWISPGMISVNNMAASSMSRSARTVMSSTPRREAECTHVQQNKNQIIVATEVEDVQSCVQSLQLKLRSHKLRFKRL